MRKRLKTHNSYDYVAEKLKDQTEFPTAKLDEFFLKLRRFDYDEEEDEITRTYRLGERLPELYNYGVLSQNDELKLVMTELQNRIFNEMLDENFVQKALGIINEDDAYRQQLGEDNAYQDYNIILSGRNPRLSELNGPDLDHYYQSQSQMKNELNRWMEHNTQFKNDIEKLSWNRIKEHTFNNKKFMDHNKFWFTNKYKDKIDSSFV